MIYLPVAEIPVLLKVSREFRMLAEEKKNAWLNEYMGFNLSAEEHQRREMLLAIIDHGEDDNEVLARRNPSMTVTRLGMKTLDAGIWLNDEVINYYIQVVLTELDENRWLNGWEYRKPSLFYSTFFLQKLFQEKSSNRRRRCTYYYSNDI